MNKFQCAKQRSTPGNKDFKGSEFHFTDFQEFASWIVQQPFYGQAKYELDKDILHVDGVKKYSAETCCLIPAELNSMLSESKIGGSGIIGVHFRPDRNKYECCVRYTLFGNVNLRKFVGRFDTAEECHQNYVREKTNIIRGVVAESFKDHVGVRVYEKLKQWSL